MSRKTTLYIALSLCLICLTQDLSAKRQKSVIIIGFDGLSSYAINNGAKMPTLRGLIAEGASSLEVRTILPSSSAPNWASIYMGVGPELHGYTTWGSQTPDLPSRELTPNGIFPDIYWALKQKNYDLKTSYIYEWPGMKYLVDTLSVDYIKHSSLSRTQTDLQLAIDHITQNRPNLCSIIFAQPDNAGHAHGWESPEYFEQLANLDLSLKMIIDAIKESGMIDNTMIVIVSDHGGINSGHGGKSMKEMQVPIVYYGDGVKRGYKIEESLMIYDVTATIGEYLDIEQPKIWLARPTKSIFK